MHSQAPQVAGRPNVLFLAIDDLRPFLGCYGDVNAHTPRIDALARRGVTFTQAMCPAPCCGPSRAAVLTGRMPTRTGLYGFQDWAGREDFAGLVTLPECFRQQGYRTFACGKIHHNANRVHAYTEEAVRRNREERDPDPAVRVPRADREWTVNAVSRTRAAPYHHRPCVPECVNWSGKPLAEAARQAKFLSGPSDDEPLDCQDGTTCAFGQEVLAQAHDQPFFLALGFVRPHLPFIVPRRYFEPYPLDRLVLHPVRADDLADVPWVGRRNARVDDDLRIARADPRGRARVVQAYYACASFVDDMVGRVLDALERSPHADNTVVVFWSDHGWHLGEKRSWRKFTLWEESARTPLIVADPRRPATAGANCGRPVGLVDLYPTLAELCGVAPPAGLDGVSLVPLLDQPAREEAAWREPELTVHGRGNYSLRDETWRYTRYFDGGEELYHHALDPYEWTNRAGDPACGDVIRRLAARLPASSAPTVEPRNLSNWADLDKDDMEQFRTEVWPRWVAEADPPLL